jgi:CubicO group peptidase (beta-lactamase class C family)
MLTKRIFASVLLLCCARASAGANLGTQIDALMQAYQGAVPGASVLVIHDGRIVARRAYGLADLEAHTAATPATAYRLASMTKQFTAAAILLLAQEGRVSLDDKIRRWLPTLPDAAAPMTLKHLLTHTSGLIDYEDLIAEGTSRQLHDTDVLRLLEGQNRTYFPPGSSYRYSDSGYALLALIVGRASGQDFASFLRARIFVPLGMRDTVAYEQGISSVAHRAYGYSRSAQAWVRTDQSLTSAVLGDGGVYSSVEDLAKWDAALYESGLLNADSRRLAFTPATRTDDPNIQYGLGWRITGATVWHSGETLGFRNVIIRWPHERLTVIVLTNRDDPEPYTLALTIAKLLLPTADAVRAGQVVVGPDSGARPLPQNPP